MYNFKILFKNNFNILLGRLAGKKQRKSTFVASMLLFIGVIGIVALYSLQAYSMFKGLGQLHLEKVCIFHAILTSLTVIVIIGIMRSSANQKNCDTDFLLSLPIKKSTIIISKTLNKYIFDFFFAFVLFAPYMVLYLIMAEFNLTLLILGILFIFVLPLLSVGISYICDFVITRLFNRMRLGNLFKSFTLLLLFVLVMGLMLIKTFTYGMADFNNLQAYFSDRPICNLILNFLFAPNVFNVLFVILGTFLPFLVGVSLYSLNYGKTFASYVSNNKNLKFSDGTNEFKMLYKKELNTYASTPAYIINTIIGAIMILVITIFICTMGYNGISNYFNLELPKSLITCILAFAFGFMLSTAPISASAISLEGKNFWLLKSTPINEKILFLSKISLHFSILEPAIVVSSILLTIFLHLPFLHFMTLLIVPTLINLIIAFGGLLINLWQPKLDYEDETKVVKQSLSVLITMVFGMIISALPYILYKIFTTLNIVNLIIISTCIYVIILITLIITLFTRGIKMFRELK